jgi:hypothetical protein
LGGENGTVRRKKKGGYVLDIIGSRDEGGILIWIGLSGKKRIRGGEDVDHTRLDRRYGNVDEAANNSRRRRERIGTWLKPSKEEIRIELHRAELPRDIRS